MEKAKYFPKEDLYGYPQPIVINELRAGTTMPLNPDVAPKGSLHSAEALAAAAQSLEEV